MSTHQNAVVAGHICLDIIPRMGEISAGDFSATFKPGRVMEIGPATLSTGGAVSNTGLALHKLGIQTRLMGKVGDDLFGQAVLDIVRSYGEGLAEGMVIDPHTNTSYTLVISPAGMDRFFFHDAGANNAFGIDDIDFEALQGFDLFHFGYPPVMKRMYADGGSELRQLFERLKAEGLTTSLDLCFPDPNSASGRLDWRRILKQTLPFVDVFSPSVDELMFMLHRDLYEQLKAKSPSGSILDSLAPGLLSSLGAQLLEMGARIVLLKLGERGAYLRTASRAVLEQAGRAAPADLADWAGKELWAPCFQVEVVGTTGSGDATIAGFLSALLRGLSPYEALKAAVAVGACNVEAADALSGLRSWEATMGRVAAGWEMQPLDLSAAGWQPNSGMWEHLL